MKSRWMRLLLTLEIIIFGVVILILGVCWVCSTLGPFWRTQWRPDTNPGCLLFQVIASLALGYSFKHLVFVFARLNRLFIFALLILYVGAWIGVSIHLWPRHVDDILESTMNSIAAVGLSLFTMFSFVENSFPRFTEFSRLLQRSDPGSDETSSRKIGQISSMPPSPEDTDHGCCDSLVPETYFCGRCGQILSTGSGGIICPRCGLVQCPTCGDS